MSAEWRLSPHFLVRGTGFPVELLTPLSCVDTSAAVDDLLDSETGLAERGRGVEELLAADVSRDRRKWWKSVHSGRSVDRVVDAPEPVRAALAAWDAHVSQHAQIRQTAQDIFAAELPKRRAELRDTFADPRFGEAVWLSSPQMYEHGLVGYLAGRGGASALRRTERQLVAYLQRFCVKNDTAAFFGPIDYGGVGDAVPGARGGGPGTVRVREAFVSAWAVAALADALAADPEIRPHLRPVRTGLLRVDLTTGVLHLPGGVEKRLSRQDTTVLSRVDGRRTVRELADDAALDRLARARLIRLVPTAPVLDAHPVRWLRDWVDDLPPDCPARACWLAELVVFVDAEARFAGEPFPAKRRLFADLEGRFARLTGGAARRGGGAFYADRLLVYEEAAGDAGPIRLTPEAAERLRERLAPVLEEFARQAVAAQERLRRWGAERLADGPMPLLTWVSALRDATPPNADGDEDTPVDLDGEVLLSSPDVMVIADSLADVEAGRGELVIGECHDTVLVWGWALRYHADPAGVERANADLLRWATGGRVLANVLPSRRIKIIPFEYPGPTVELAASSAKADRLRIPAADVTVELRDGRPTLTAPGVGDFTLYNGELHTPAHRVVASPRVVPPRDTGSAAHTPRQRIGSVVVGRERWRVRPGELFPGAYQGDSLDLLVDYRRAARRLGLPRFVFARVAAETKPVFVDAQSWFLVAMLHHLIRDAEEVVLTEMLPTPDQLWLAGRDGHYCVELRLTMFRGRANELAATR